MECLTKIKTYVAKDSLPPCVELCKQAEWQSWLEIATDIPSFYKNYNNLSSLASALGGVSGETMPTTAVIPQGGSITISGTGLYLVKMSRNSITTIVQNAWTGVFPIADTFTVNGTLIRFDKTPESQDFAITDLTTNTTDMQRTIFYRKLW